MQARNEIKGMAHILEWRLASKWVPHPLISESYNYLYSREWYSDIREQQSFHLPSIEDKNFADSKPITKTAKIVYLENLYVYGMYFIVLYSRDPKCVFNRPFSRNTEIQYNVNMRASFHWYCRLCVTA